MPALGLLWLLVAAPDLLVADLEGRTYDPWTATGEAFGPGPAEGTLPHQMEVTGYRGRRLANSFHGGDGSVGTLTSPPFEILRPYLNFRVGGGRYPGEVCLDLLLDGRVVRTATGPNDRPGGSERLAPASWDVRDLLGRTVQLRVLDQRRGGWGHLNVDHIVQSERDAMADCQRAFRITRRYLNLPVQTGAPKQHCALLVAGQAVREFTLELAPADPQFWVFLDLAPFTGRDAVLQVTDAPAGSQGLANVVQDDTVPGFETLYQEPARPQFHFTSRRGWNNDPNGLVYHAGEWHLFYQHNPYGVGWGNMHWGHAVSRDLVHWTELPIAIYPARFGDWAYSGSAMVDEQNTGGFQTGPAAPLVAAYTSTGRGECLRISHDAGATWHEYSGNPVLQHRGRDPRLLWHAPTGQWVMAVYEESGPQDREQRTESIAFHTSPDLRTWTHRSTIDGYYECPDLFELPVEGEATRRWVLSAADGGYAVGAFDGGQFVPDGAKQPLFRGGCLYAAQTFSNVPPEDGRRIQIAWARVAAPGMPFAQAMGFPVELTLRRTAAGLRLAAWPVREIETLYEARVTRSNVAVSGEVPLPEVAGELLDIEAEIVVGTVATVGLEVRGVPIVWRAADQTLTCQQATAPLPAVDGRIRLRVLVDRQLVEIYANGGEAYLVVPAVPDPTARGLTLTAGGGAATVAALEVRRLRSAWPSTAP